ncbi:hypothetical protein PR048_019518 [Dryococelus australis]|uniref:Uncharacterized protein n=1 Tax=Dryococelus australis TaxID=614101 RepID=A0ABQ9H3R0_9NEOP|nr:hypothetical protein PR048_019518 [Dryococelus australis]
MSIFIRQFTASFVQFSAIQQASDVTSIGFGRKNQLPDAGLFIGHTKLTHLENNQIGSQEETEFFTSVHKFYKMGAKDLYCLLPLKNGVLKNIDIFDPTKELSGEWIKVQYLAKAFLNVITNNEYDELNSEFFCVYSKIHQQN